MSKALGYRDPPQYYKGKKFFKRWGEETGNSM
jgi:hypothetical protein